MSASHKTDAYTKDRDETYKIHNSASVSCSVGKGYCKFVLVYLGWHLSAIIILTHNTHLPGSMSRSKSTDISEQNKGGYRHVHTSQSVSCSARKGIFMCVVNSINIFGKVLCQIAFIT